MEADFMDDPNQGCVCGEFECRQWIRGRFLRKRWSDPAVQTVAHFLPGNRPLSATSWNLDGEGGLIYGRRREQANNDNDEYLLDRRTGCRYRGHDAPSIRIDANDELVGMDLEFRGEVVHMAAGGARTSVVSSTWDVADVYLVRQTGGTPPGGSPPVQPKRTGTLKGAISYGDNDPDC
jgi:hypothetical protein